MEVFISWSGKQSKQVAQALQDFLPKCIQSIVPWMSDDDIGKGANWPVALANRLEKTNACIACLTPGNLSSEWLHFETGAASKAVGSSLVCPFCVGLSKEAVVGPLANLQGADNTKEDTQKLIKSLYKKIEAEKPNYKIVEQSFGQFWPEFETQLNNIDFSDSQVPPQRDSTDMLEELLERVRRIERQVSERSIAAPSILPASIKRYEDSLKSLMKQRENELPAFWANWLMTSIEARDEQNKRDRDNDVEGGNEDDSSESGTP